MPIKVQSTLVTFIPLFWPQVAVSLHYFALPACDLFFAPTVAVENPTKPQTKHTVLQLKQHNVRQCSNTPYMDCEVFRRGF